MSGFSLDDYQTVAERIAEFYKKHPKGALRRIGDVVTMSIGGKNFIGYTAGAWRDASTEQPDGVGTAWEPVPGPTQFTKDSELMNAETAAWGRAIVACGAATAQKIATREDVQNRQSPPAPVANADGLTGDRRAVADEYKELSDVDRQTWLKAVGLAKLTPALLKSMDDQKVTDLLNAMPVPF